jgi:hypothetical protein
MPTSLDYLRGDATIKMNPSRDTDKRVYLNQKDKND